jgi:hypothetical protein
MSMQKHSQKQEQLSKQSDDMNNQRNRIEKEIKPIIVKAAAQKDL